MYWWIWVIIGLCGAILLALLIGSLILTILALYRHSAWDSGKKEWTPRYHEKKDIDLAYQMIDWFSCHGEDVWITSHDGLKLHGKYFKKLGAKKTILLVHGYRGNPAGDFCIVNSWLKDIDVNYLEIDQRSHGQSEGRWISMGIKEKEDIHTWVDYLMTINDNPIYLWGLSMGCATVLMSLDKPYPERVRGVIADCGFYSAYQEFKEMFSKHTSKFLATLLLQFVCFWSALILHINIRGTDTRKALKKNKLPIFFAHGLKDNMVPSYMTVENVKACVCEKIVLYVPDAYHARSFLMGGDVYKGNVYKILDK